jgi:hypothetical protein
MASILSIQLSAELIFENTQGDPLQSLISWLNDIFEKLLSFTSVLNFNIKNHT